METTNLSSEMLKKMIITLLDFLGFEGKESASYCATFSMPEDMHKNTETTEGMEKKNMQTAHCSLFFSGL